MLVDEPTATWGTRLSSLPSGKREASDVLYDNRAGKPFHGLAELNVVRSVPPLTGAVLRLRKIGRLQAFEAPGVAWDDAGRTHP
ncbi:hypothetical protein GCM10010405_43430 [Streptomyces macrosporus]|uniref:Uncharacterized protein n=1 Tax=Streptomyces macrosporus TaxID=44032 RepID=A0ABN3KCB3_9ACTN